MKNAIDDVIRNTLKLNEGVELNEAKASEIEKAPEVTDNCKNCGAKGDNSTMDYAKLVAKVGGKEVEVCENDADNAEVKSRIKKFVSDQENLINKYSKEHNLIAESVKVYKGKVKTKINESLEDIKKAYEDKGYTDVEVDFCEDDVNGKYIGATFKTPGGTKSMSMLPNDIEKAVKIVVSE